MALGDSISKDLSYLYERLLYKLSDEGFYDPVSIGGFLVIFTFCTVTLVLMLLVVVSEWCFQEPVRSNKVAALVTSAPSETVPVAKHRPIVKKKPRQVCLRRVRRRCQKHLSRRPKISPVQEEPTLSTAVH